MTTLLPTDANNQVIPAMRFKQSGSHILPFGETPQKNSIAFAPTTQVISLYATGPIFIAFGDITVTANTSDHFFPEGVYYDIAIQSKGSAQYTHISAIRAEDYDGTLYISEKE